MSRFTSTVRSTLLAAATIAIGLVTNTASAQVGHLPSKSPYEDLKPTQDVTLYLGHFGSDLGIAGIFPRPSLFGGFRYDVPLSGPGFLTVHYIVVPSDRKFLLPTNSAAKRVLGTTNETTHEADVGFSIALTGRKTYHRLVPSISGGVGVASSFAKADTGGYKFGTKFAVNYGANIRYVMHNGYGVRAEATSFVWQNRYPDSYLLPSPSDSTSVIHTSSERSSWHKHIALSLGFFFPIFR